MTQTAESLKRQIESAGDLKSVVRTMKTLAAVSIVQYEAAVTSLGGYDRAVELGLTGLLRQFKGLSGDGERPAAGARTGAVVFGSDQGMVGQFNDVLAATVTKALEAHKQKARVWAVGERVHSRLAGNDLALEPPYRVPDSVGGVAPLIGRVLLDVQEARRTDGVHEVLVFHNQPMDGGAYVPTTRRLLPFDREWVGEVRAREWPTNRLPEVMQEERAMLSALVGEYLFVSMFKACAESLASENAGRLAAMQRAERNIDELLADLRGRFNQNRQTKITEELFDVIAGFECMAKEKRTVAG